MSKAEERLRELEERAKNGDGDAQRRLGDFWNQQGNHSEAINQWGKAAENGDRVAKSRMYNHLKKKVDKEKKEGTGCGAAAAGLKRRKTRSQRGRVCCACVRQSKALSRKQEYC